MMRLLLTADLHLGRSSTGLPPSVSDIPLALSCREAWKRIVVLAVREEVNAILIAGDLVEDSGAYYESLGPLVDGFRLLTDAGIQVFATGGNHDARAFERIAADCSELNGVHFLGRRGQWERAALTIDGSERLWIEGWSFPDLRHPSDPASGYNLEPVSGLPAIGLLHADLGNPGSPYAPTTAIALRELPVNFWLLGHIHKPTRIERSGEATILYPGSPQAMDFGETGWHGVWILEVDNGDKKLSQIQTSTVRFENTLEVELSANHDQEAVETAIRSGAVEWFEDLKPWERAELRCVVHRALLRGECEQADLINALQNTLPVLLPPEKDGLIASFDGQLIDRTVLPIDLSKSATRGGAIARLARTILDLESDAWQEAPWFASIYAEVQKDYNSCRIEGDNVVRDNGERPFGPPDREVVRSGLARQARRLLLAARGDDS